MFIMLKRENEKLNKPSWNQDQINQEDCHKNEIPLLHNLVHHNEILHRLLLMVNCHKMMPEREEGELLEYLYC